jgi:hypothetical protein
MRSHGLPTRIEWILVAAFFLGSAALFAPVNRLHDPGASPSHRSGVGSHVAAPGRSAPETCDQPWRIHSMTSLVMQMPRHIGC